MNWQSGTRTIRIRRDHIYTCQLITWFFQLGFTVGGIGPSELRSRL